MSEVKQTRGGARKGAGRKNPPTKTCAMFGYKYTPEEAQNMKDALTEIKKKTGKTTSKILYDLLLGNSETI